MALQLSDDLADTSLQCAEGSLLQNKTSYSVAGWLYAQDGTGHSIGDTGTKWVTIASAGTLGTNAYVIATIHDAGGDVVLQSAAGSLKPRTWTHIALTVDGAGDPTAQLLYLNGVQIDEAAEVSAATQDLAGTWQLFSPTLKTGVFYRWAVWDSHVLSVAEIQQMLLGTEPDDLDNSADAYWTLSKLEGNFAVTDAELDDEVGDVDFGTLASGGAGWVNYTPDMSPGRAYAHLGTGDSGIWMS